MKSNKWKERKDIVYSTNPDFKYDYENTEGELSTMDPGKQKLRVYMDSKARSKGKLATVVNGFIGSDDDLKELAKLLKTKCAVGGTIKDKEVIIQGDFRDKIIQILSAQGYKVSKL